MKEELTARLAKEKAASESRRQQKFLRGVFKTTLESFWLWWFNRIVS
jgi:hypothetical protein